MSNDNFKQQILRQAAEVFGQRAAYIDSHWSEIVEDFCQSEIKQFHNFLFRKMIKQPPSIQDPLNPP